MLEFVDQLFAWYNLIYTFPLFLLGIYLILHLLGTELGSGAEPHLGDIALGADDDLSPSNQGQRLRSFFRVGELPLMMIVGIAGICWGVLGNAVNHVLLQIRGHYPGIFFPLSLGMTVLFSLILTKLFIEILVTLFPTAPPSSTSAADLVGRTATILSVQVDRRFGRARTQTEEGHTITLFCRSSSDELIRQGDEVILVDYDPETRMFEVEKLDVS